MSLKTAVIDKVARTDFVSYVELGKLDNSGSERTWAHQDESVNIMFWHNMSKGLASAIEEAQKQGEIHPHGSDLLVYLIDGAVPDMPIVGTKPPRGGYKEMHWAPVVFRVGRSCSHKLCPWRK